MILFKLKCSAGHEFEAWFRDNAACERQQARHQIACPECGDSAVEKAPMAPRLGRSRGEPPKRPQREEQPRQEVQAPAPATDAPRSPADMRRALQELRKQVETHCDYVGPHFADEARAIHRGEAPSRGIYGEATKAESEKLADEGIEVASIPWVPPTDA